MGHITSILLDSFVKSLLLIIVLHLIMGSDLELVVGDIVMVLRLFGGIIAFGLAIFFAQMAYYAIKNKDVYERNRRATLLLRKYAKGSLTAEEKERFEMYCKRGVLTHNSNGVLRLSDQSIRDLYS